MVSTLKDFWFQILLLVLGSAFGIPATMSEGNARKVWLSIMGGLLVVAWLSFLWGSPVRGPFTGLTSPNHPNRFFVFVGSNTYDVPIDRLNDGFDVAEKFDMRGTKLILKYRWWSGWKNDLTMHIVGDKHNYPLMKDSKILRENVPEGFDLNFDENTIEFVDDHEHPIFQLLLDDENKNVRINAVLVINKFSAQVYNDTGMWVKPLSAMTINDFPKRLFKYPSYANLHIRQ